MLGSTPARSSLSLRAVPAIRGLLPLSPQNRRDQRRLETIICGHDPLDTVVATRDRDDLPPPTLLRARRRPPSRAMPDLPAGVVRPRCRATIRSGLRLPSPPLR